MIISFKQIQQAMQVYGKHNNKADKGKIAKTEKSSKLDELNLSTQGQDVQTAKKAISQLPEVRGEKVAQIKQAVKCGTYDVSGDEIAEKMLGRSLVDKLI